MGQFSIVVIGIMMAFALIAILLIAGVIPGFHVGGGGGGAPIVATIWGSIPTENLKDFISYFNEKNQKLFTLNYVEKNPATFETELLNALAAGSGPNIWFLNQDFILKDKNKIIQIPFASFAERSFKDAFIQEGELYLSKDGIIALPFMEDPIVLYRNRDLFDAAGLAGAPQTWDDFVADVSRLTVRDVSGNITQAGAALGEFQNIDHADDLISLLILQAGNAIVNPGTLRSELAGQAGEINPAENAVRFYTEFSDPTKTTYSWNRSLPSAKNAFIGGTLAMYFGYASEYKDISAKNPHLNFDVSAVPQIKNSKIQATYANVEGLAISKSSPNLNQVVAAAGAMISKDSLAKLVEGTFLPPVRRDLLSETPQDPVLAVFYKSAIQGRGWLKPDPQEVSNMFATMIEDVISGKKKIADAVRDVHLKLDAMLIKINEQEQKPAE